MNSQRKKPRLQGKNSAHRNAVIRSLVLELIRNERLQSTPKKVKILKQKFDRLITNAKKDSEASRRKVSAFLRNEKAEEKLFNNLLPRLDDRNSGYTLTARTLPRKGDNAEQMIIMIPGAKIKQKRTRLQRLLGDASSNSNSQQSADTSKPVRREAKQDASQKKESVQQVRRNSK